MTRSLAGGRILSMVSGPTACTVEYSVGATRQ